jgi:hypothetical protein
MMRARASASATREVSIVIQRRPHCSAPAETMLDAGGQRQRHRGMHRSQGGMVGLCWEIWISHHPAATMKKRAGGGFHVITSLLSRDHVMDYSRK